MLSIIGGWSSMRYDSARVFTPLGWLFSTSTLTSLRGDSPAASGVLARWVSSIFPC